MLEASAGCDAAACTKQITLTLLMDELLYMPPPARRRTGDERHAAMQLL
jgi:hypothetical protein